MVIKWMRFQYIDTTILYKNSSAGTMETERQGVEPFLRRKESIHESRRTGGCEPDCDQTGALA